MDRQLSAFIAGLFIGLMIIRHVGRKVVEVETERQGVASDGKSTTTPAAKIELVARHA